MYLCLCLATLDAADLNARWGEMRGMTGGGTPANSFFGRSWNVKSRNTNNSPTGLFNFSLRTYPTRRRNATCALQCSTRLLRGAGSLWNVKTRKPFYKKGVSRRARVIEMRSLRCVGRMLFVAHRMAEANGEASAFALSRFHIP